MNTATLAGVFSILDRSRNDIAYILVKKTARISLYPIDIMEDRWLGFILFKILAPY
jgi:hypothetical protein